MKIPDLKIISPLGERLIGLTQPVFIVAEMSGNHNQSINQAKRIIDAAAQAGVDAVKLQTYTPDTITIDSDKEYFQVKVNDTWKGQTLYQLYQKTYTPWEWHEELRDYAVKQGLIFFSTPFDDTAVDFLEGLNVPLYKIASFELVDVPLLKKIASTKKPVIISRGMSNEAEINLAIKTLKDFGCPSISLLHCVSAYPAKTEEMNLATIADLTQRFGVVPGLSDHSLSPHVPAVALGLGAKVIEKHLTLNRADGGPDAAFSLEPQEFKNLVGTLRDLERGLGQARYDVLPQEQENIIFRKSLFVVADVRKGETLNKQNVRSIRPGHGLEPKYYDEVLGKEAAVDIKRGTPLAWGLIKK
ncbi:MAG: pseudaminic acid synthase [Candidatus Buchananbacteria bacterium]|nr:pseudaminic acid synthase [Candidatus Buchananbacteria bacterium]